MVNRDESIDLAMLALTLGATFVARGFSGDKEQLVPLIKAAVEHRGAALIDIVSPCVAFNNHMGSTKSYDYVREHNDAVNRLDFISSREAITTEYAPGETRDVLMHDGGTIRLRKLNDDYEATDKVSAMAFLEARRQAGEVVTGSLYLHPAATDLHDALETVAAPLNTLGDADLVPGNAALAAVNASLR